MPVISQEPVGKTLLGYAAASNVVVASLFESFGQVNFFGDIYGVLGTPRDNMKKVAIFSK